MGLIFCLTCFAITLFITTKFLYREFIKFQNRADLGYKTSVPSAREPMLYKNSIYRDRAATYIGEGIVNGEWVGRYIGGGVVTDVGSSSSPKAKKKTYPIVGGMYIDSSGSDANCAHHGGSADCHSGDCHHG